MAVCNIERGGTYFFTFTARSLNAAYSSSASIDRDVLYYNALLMLDALQRTTACSPADAESL